MGNRKKLRKGFSSGTAVVAGVIGALKSLSSDKKNIEGNVPCSVKLPLGFYLPVYVNIVSSNRELMEATSEVRKDGGDDPDVTHGMIFRTRVRLFSSKKQKGIFIKAGKGIGVVTREGLAVKVGEPAINPVPRIMLRENVEQALSNAKLPSIPSNHDDFNPKADIFLPYQKNSSSLPSLFVEITVPKGETICRKTLNPKLGIMGGISILGTTGIVTPFSHDAFRETIIAEMKFARKNGCSTVVLSTGGKSEKFAKKVLPDLPDEAFIQIADFFKFSVAKAYEFGFDKLIHSLFFGKTLKMALGYEYTHAHSSTMDIETFVNKHLPDISDELKEKARQANTARHLLSILKEYNRSDIIRKIAELALKKSREFSPSMRHIELFLFDYDGTLLCFLEDVKNAPLA